MHFSVLVSFKLSKLWIEPSVLFGGISFINPEQEMNEESDPESASSSSVDLNSSYLRQSRDVQKHG